MTFNEILEKHQFIAGIAFAFAGGALSFGATTFRDWKNKSKDEKKEYENFKMNVFAELNEIHLELIDAVKERDVAYMEYLDEKGTVRSFLPTQDGSPKELDLLKGKLDGCNKTVRTLKNKFTKQLSFYLYKKDYKSNALEHQTQFLTKGLKYEPETYSDWAAGIDRPGLTAKFDYQRQRKLIYDGYHGANVVMPLTHILMAVLKDK